MPVISNLIFTQPSNAGTEHFTVVMATRLHKQKLTLIQ